MQNLKEHEDSFKSDWNSSKASLIRIDSLLAMCNRFSSQRLYRDWFQVLGSLHRELFPFLTKAERENLSKQEKESSQKVNAFVQASQHRNSEQRSYELGRASFQAYEKIDVFEKALRSAMSSHGLLISASDADPSDAVFG